jgi:hypothetical protein
MTPVEHTKRIETEVDGLEFYVHFALDPETAEPSTFQIDFVIGKSCRSGQSIHIKTCESKKIFTEMDWILSEEFQDEFDMQAEQDVKDFNEACEESI